MTWIPIEEKKRRWATTLGADLTRYRALLDYAFECEQEAMKVSSCSPYAAEMWHEALQARLAALALEAEADANR